MNIKQFEKKLDLCLAKLSKQSDLDWIEIVEKLSLDCSPDHLRKLSYAYKEYNTYVEEKGLDRISKEMQAKITKQALDIKKKTIQLNDLRAEVNRQSRYQARYEQLLNTVKYCCDKMSETKPFYSQELILPKESEISREGVLLLSDLHYGLDTKHFWNDYDSEEFNKRCKVLTQRVIDISKKDKVKKVNILGLGDYINGLIHTTTRLSNRESIAEQVIEVSEGIADIVYNISKSGFYVTLSMTDDNHSRIFADKKENTDKDSFVPFIKKYIQNRIKDLSNVTFLDNHIDNGMIVLNICDCTVVGVHGDKDNIKTAIPRLTSMLKTNIDYLFMGHYHSIKEDTEGESEIIVNGSFGGTDEYAKNLRLHSKPMQKYMIFSKEYGRECTYNIDLRGGKNA